VVVGLAAATLLFTVCVTGRAEAARHVGSKVVPGNVLGVVDLGRAGPYRIGLYMPSDRAAILYVSRHTPKGPGDFTIQTSAYAVRPRVSLERGWIRARFGSLGAFSLRFRPNGRVRRGDPQPGCEGRPSVSEYGRFVGRASFHGENGFIDFTRGGGAGLIIRTSTMICKRTVAVESSRKSLRAYVAPPYFFATDGDLALLYATSHRHGRYVGVIAGHVEESPPGADLSVEVIESRPAMAIGRYASVSEVPGTLLTSLPGVHPASAVLDPPAPFYGSGSYSEGAGAGEWSGSLGVELPGLKLSLTGPEFHTRLCVLNPLRTRHGCDFFKAESPPPDERTAPRRPALR
jgi:hypothetical protein